MKKALKIIGISIGVLVVAGGIALWIAHEPRPEGTEGAEADALAERMLDAINYTAWDTTRWVQWTFAERHSFVWDKERHLVQVTWKNNRVLLNPNEISGKTYVNSKEIQDESAKKLVQKAWEYFANDGFWLNAPAKAFDPGTSRSIVERKDGTQGLLITYSSGGVTPGDAYLWVLDEQGLPQKWKMWVSIIPIGGVEASWTDWTTLSTGAKVATNHKLGPVHLTVTNLKAAQSWEELGLTEDPFATLGN